MLLALPVALIAGMFSFFSPCVLPLIPGYLSYATGMSGGDLTAGSYSRSKLLLGSLLFVAGFSTVFILMGAAFGTAGYWLTRNQRDISIVLGIITILFGLAFVGSVPLLQRDARIHKVPAVGVLAAPLLGILFGLGWTPCIGPTLSVILTLSLGEATAARGALLAFVYALGLGAPFIFAGLLFQRFVAGAALIRRHQRWVTRAGGIMLTTVGVLIVTGWWDHIVQTLQVTLTSAYTPSI